MCDQQDELDDLILCGWLDPVDADRPAGCVLLDAEGNEVHG